MRVYLVAPPNNPAWPEVEIFNALRIYCPEVEVLAELGAPSSGAREVYDPTLAVDLCTRTLDAFSGMRAGGVLLHTETFTPAPFAIRNSDRGVRQGGLLHGGSFLEHDSISLPPYVERAMVSSMDSVFVPTHWVKGQYDRVYDTPCVVASYPLSPALFSFIPTRPQDRGKVILFPHHKIPEKGWPLFQECQKSAPPNLGSWEAVSLPRLDFYSKLIRSKVVFANTQFGLCCVAIEEAMVLGCCPVLNRYPVFEEMYAGCDVHWHDGTVDSVLAAVSDAMCCTREHYHLTPEVNKARAQRIIDNCSRVGGM